MAKKIGAVEAAMAAGEAAFVEDALVGDLATALARVAELEAALAVVSAPKQRKADRVGECECGCGAVVRGKARFQMGHDAKLKSRLIAEALAGNEDSAKRLADLGWVSFLGEARMRKAIKEAAKAASAAKKAAKEEAEAEEIEDEPETDEEE